MNTREIAKEYRLMHWTQIMKERKESGLGVKAFCKKAGIHENTYYYWQKKLRETACEEIAALKQKNRNLTIPAFTEVKISENVRPIIYTEEYAQNKINIKAAGVCVSADIDYPADKLALLLREMMQPC